MPTQPYTAEDFRFTTSKDGNTLYAFCFGVPENEFRIASLGSDSKLGNRAIKTVDILGVPGKVEWKQEKEHLVVAKPADLPGKEATCIRVTFRP